MRPRQSPSPALLQLARLQSGVLSTEQIAGDDLSSKSVARLVAEGRWQRMGTGLIVARPDPPDWMARAWAGVLLGGDHARVGSRAAAHLWGFLDGSDEPDEIVVYVPIARQLSDRHGWRFVRERVGYRRRSRGTLPLTGVEDTVLDVCAEAEEAEVISTVAAAIQHQLTRPERLAKRLEERGRSRHHGLIADLVADVAEGAQTPLELTYLQDVERAHGLPCGERQSRTGRAVHDVRYRRFTTLVELDGRLGHEGRGRFRDMKRDNRSLVRGEVTLRYGHADVHLRGCQVAFQVGGVLAQRGWDGVPTRCPRCQNAPLSDLLDFSGT